MSAEWIAVIVAIVGVVVATVLGIATLILMWRKKSLAYFIEASTNIVTVSDKRLADQIQVLYQGKPVADAKLIVVRIENDGNQEVRVADYDKPILFCFGSDTKLLSFEVVAKQPTSLDPELVPHSESCVQLQPLLLNKRDSTTLKFVVSGKGEFEVGGRIAGIQQIRRLRRQSRLSTVVTVLVVAALAVSLGVLANLVSDQMAQNQLGGVAPLLVMLMAFFAGTVVASRLLDRSKD